MIISNFPILPDSIFNALVVMGALAAAVYIAEDNVRTARMKNTPCEEEAPKTARRIAELYVTAACGDAEDCGYWYDTAELFMEGE